MAAVVRRWLLAVVAVALLSVVAAPVGASGTDDDSVKEDFGEIADLESPEFPRFTLGGSVGDVDRFEFSLSERKRVAIGLRQLQVNADLFVDDSGGTVVARSERSGLTREWISLDLSAGDYVIRVVAAQAGGTDYVLRYGVSEPQTPEPETPEPETPKTPRTPDSELRSELYNRYNDDDDIVQGAVDTAGSVAPNDPQWETNPPRGGTGLEEASVEIEVELDDPDNPTNITWQWQRADAEAGPYTDIPGATSATYSPTTDDAGKWLRAVATYDDDEGNGQTAMWTAPFAAKVGIVTLTNDDPPRVGVEMEATLSDPDSPSTVEWQWQYAAASGRLQVPIPCFQWKLQHLYAE